jgi:hypothetical protein
MSIIRPQGAVGALRASGLAVMALLIAGIAAAAWHHAPASYADTLALSGNGTAGAPTQPATISTAAGSFRISGNVAGLYPGAQLPLVLTVTNPEHFAIVVTTLSVSIGAAAPGCAAVNLTATSFSGQLQVPAGGTATLSVHVAMAHSAPDACQGAVFPLRYSGLAGKAG